MALILAIKGYLNQTSERFLKENKQALLFIVDDKQVWGMTF